VHFSFQSNSNKQCAVHMCCCLTAIWPAEAVSCLIAHSWVRKFRCVSVICQTIPNVLKSHHQLTPSAPLIYLVIILFINYLPLASHLQFCSCIYPMFTAHHQLIPVQVPVLVHQIRDFSKRRSEQDFFTIDQRDVIRRNSLRFTKRPISLPYAALNEI